MTCPKCGGPTRTIDTRELRSNGKKNYVRRRRQCQRCRRRFTTAEGVVDDYASSNIMMVQRKTMETLLRTLASTFAVNAPSQVTRLLEVLTDPASDEISGS